MPQPEAIVPFDGPREVVQMASSLRSTWLTSSIKAIRERKLLERYLAVLPPEYHANILNSVVGVWLPIEVAMAHYGACESLGLSLEDQIAIGREVTTVTNRASYALALRLAKGVGVTPWLCFTMQKRLWKQTWRGGDVGTFKLGPKEALVEIIGWPCSRIVYVRRAMRGVLLGQTELFCKKAYVHEVSALNSATSLGYRVSWI
jgi:hypothetical protein